MKKRKKGFTLVELLAVIVILAIILVIAVPKILDIIDESKKSAFKVSAEIMVENAHNRYIENNLLGINSNLECSDVSKYDSTNYKSCSLTKTDTSVSITVVGDGKFEGLAICNGTKGNIEVIEGEDCSNTTYTIAYNLKGGNFPKKEQEVQYTDTLSWDGSPTSALECFAASDYATCRVSNTIITQEDLANGFTFKAIVNGEEKTYTQDDMEIDIELGNAISQDGFGFGFLGESISETDANGNNVTLKPGIYFMSISDFLYYSKELKINNFNKFILPTESSSEKQGNTLAWNGDSTGLECFEMTTGYKYCKVSDTPLKKKDLENGFTAFGCDNANDGCFMVTQDNVSFFEEEGVLGLVVDYNGEELNFITSVEKDIDVDGLTVSKGIYFLLMNDAAYAESITINNYTGFTNAENITNATDKIKWNEDKTGLDCTQGLDEGVIFSYCKVSDNVITQSDLANGLSMTLTVYIEGEYVNKIFYTEDGSDCEYSEEYNSINCGIYFMSFGSDFEEDGIKVTKGTYFINANGPYIYSWTSSLKINGYSGFIEDDSAPRKYNSSMSVEIPVPEREGYTFLGWTGSNGTSPQVNVKIPVGSSGNKEYTANWERNNNGTAQAIYSDDDKSLTFVFRETLYKPGDKFTDRDGLSKTVTAVYTGFEEEEYEIEEIEDGGLSEAFFIHKNGTPKTPWGEYVGEIKKVVFEDEIIPISTQAWFYGFNKCEEFDLTKLNTSSVTNMSDMFFGAGDNTAKLKGISSWDTSNVKYMAGMFSGTNAVIGNLSSWNTSNVIDMSYMFRGAEQSNEEFDLGNLNKWNTSKVTNMKAMFFGAGLSATTWNIGNLNNWNTSKVTSMSAMFENACGEDTICIIGDLSNWNTTSVTDMSLMFVNAFSYVKEISLGNLGNWNVSNVKDMSNMFAGIGFHEGDECNIGDLSNWDVSNVTNMAEMFDWFCSNGTTLGIGDLSNWDVSKVTNMSEMFSHTAQNVTTWSIGNLSNWNVSNVKDMSRMFEEAGSSAKSFNLNLSNWDVSNVTNMSKMFKFISGDDDATEFNLNLSNWKLLSVENIAECFSDFGVYASKVYINVSNWDTSNVTDMSSLFAGVGLKSNSIKIVGLNTWDVSNVTNMHEMFSHIGADEVYKCDINITFDIGNLSNWNTSNVTDMSEMFSHTGLCSTTWSVGDLSGWNVTKVTDHTDFNRGVESKINAPTFTS